jgi:hypothetical protein
LRVEIDEVIERRTAPLVADVHNEKGCDESHACAETYIVIGGNTIVGREYNARSEIYIATGGHSVSICGSLQIIQGPKWLVFDAPNL